MSVCGCCLGRCSIVVAARQTLLAYWQQSSLAVVWSERAKPQAHSFGGDIQLGAFALAPVRLDAEPVAGVRGHVQVDMEDLLERGPPTSILAGVHPEPPETTLTDP